MPVLSNPRHELFAQGVAKGLSQREAYKAAGYETETDEATDAAASRLLSDVKVELRVQALLEQGAKRAGITAERIAVELGKIGFANITQAVKWGEAIAVKDSEGGEDRIVQGVELVASDELPEEVSAAISEVSKSKDGIKIKFHDKRAALVDLGKHLGMFKDVVEHTGKDGKDLIPETNEVETARRVAFLLAQGVVKAGD